MIEVSRQQVALLALAIVAVGMIGARYLQEERERSSPGARLTVGPQQPARLQISSERAVVHVTGAVRRPGVYRVSPGARLDRAVRRAGGPTRGADLEGVNLAARLSDGQQVVVPRRAPGAGNSQAADAAGGGVVPISLNSATAEQLDELDGVGPATAGKILDWRKQHGGFRSVDDLKQVSGIGPKRFAALKDKVRM